MELRTVRLPSYGNRMERLCINIDSIRRLPTTSTAEGYVWIRSVRCVKKRPVLMLHGYVRVRVPRRASEEAIRERLRDEALRFLDIA